MDIFYFNELDRYDEYNPSYYLDRNNAKNIIKFIAKKPYSVNLNFIYNNVNLNNKE